MTTVCNFLGILQCLRRIWKEASHLFLTFHIELTALVTHTILVGNLLSRLDT